MVLLPMQGKQRSSGGGAACLLCCFLLLWGGSSIPMAAGFLQTGSGRDSEAPVEENESSSEEAVCTVARTPLRRKSLPISTVVVDSAPSNVALVAAAVTTSSGHRLANGLCAPLRC